MDKKPGAVGLSSRYSDPWYRRPGVVYFVAAGDVAIKIGVSTHVGFEARMRSIQGANHEHIEVLGKIHFEQSDHELPMLAAERCERELHKQFHDFCCAKPGCVGSEWFRAVPEIRAFIEKEIAAGRAIR
jgi:hypothetical protein